MDNAGAVRHGGDMPEIAGYTSICFMDELKLPQWSSIGKREAIQSRMKVQMTQFPWIRQSRSDRFCAITDEDDAAAPRPHNGC